jgi:hypothetical protein
MLKASTTFSKKLWANSRFGHWLNWKTGLPYFMKNTIKSMDTWLNSLPGTGDFLEMLEKQSD